MLSINGMKVTCIIPCYNSELFIADTIKSCLAQTYTNIEIIVVDDGSTDKTIEILHDISPGIKVLNHKGEENLGKSASLNLGIKEAKGELIAFLDHDDLWVPDKIEKLINHFNKYPRVGLVYSNGFWMGPKGKIGSLILPVTFKESNKPIDLLMDCYIKSASSVIVKASVFDEVGFFDEELTGCDDHDMWLRITEKYEITYVDEPLYKYRCHDNQLSHDIRMWEGGFAILDKACARNGYNFCTKRKRLAILYYRIGQYEWQCRNYHKAVFKFLLAGILDPRRAIVVFFEKVGI